MKNLKQRRNIMHNCKRHLFILVLILGLLFVPIGVMGYSSFVSPTFVLAESAVDEDSTQDDYADLSEELRNLLVACDNLNKIENYLDSNAENYLSAFYSAYKVLDNSIASDKNLINTTYKNKYDEASAKYSTLNEQKSYIEKYDEAWGQVNLITNVDNSNRNDIVKWLNSYDKQVALLEENCLSAYINSDHTERVKTIKDTINSLNTQITRPMFSFNLKAENLDNGTLVFVYDGQKHKMTKVDEQLGVSPIVGYSPTTMQLGSLNTDTGVVDIGEYEITIEPQAGYEWKTGDDKKEAIKFCYKIVKADFKYVEYVKLNKLNKTFDGQGHSLSLILEDSQEARFALKEGGYDFDAVNADVEGFLKEQGLSVEYYYNNIKVNSVSNVGTYNVVAKFVSEENFKSYNEIDPLSSTLVINGVEVSYLDTQLVEKAMLSVDGTGYIVPDTKLLVTEISASEFPLDQNSTKFRKYIAENEEIVFSYDIKVTGEIAGKLELRVLLPEAVKNKDFKLLHVHGNETYYTVDVVDYSIDGDYVVFNLVDFSTFSFVCQKDNTLAWWAILILAIAGLVVVLMALYLTLFYLWKKNGTTRVKALIPYFESTYKTLYKIDYEKHKELTGGKVKLLEDAKVGTESDKVADSNTISLTQGNEQAKNVDNTPLTQDDTAKENILDTTNNKDVKPIDETVAQSSNKTKSNKNSTQDGNLSPKKVGRPRKEKVMTAPKKRGRPKKEVETPKVAKKRGRPKKERVETAPKKRGRPRKETVKKSKQGRGRPRKTIKSDT